MLKKLLLVSLIALIPVQAWAVLDMSMQKQRLTADAASHEMVASHPCHQFGKTVSMDYPSSTQLAQDSSSDRCYSCTLCMAFGLLPASTALTLTDQFSQTLHTSQKILAGIDRIVFSKPPIL